MRLIDVVDKKFPFRPLDPSKRSRRRIALTALPVCVEGGDACPKGFRLTNPEPNENDDNSAVTFYFQVPSKEIEDYIMLELLAEVIEQPFYDDLRTQQQLGYIVGSGARAREGIKHLTLTAQSNIVDGAELTRRIETFITENFIPSLAVRIYDHAELFERRDYTSQAISSFYSILSFCFDPLFSRLI